VSEYDDKGKVALWVGKSTHERAPKYKGHAYAHRDIKAGEKIAVALWGNEPGDRRPVLRGKLEDYRDGSGEASTKPAATAATQANDDPNDEIPF
jgi:hypothetical protein